jgi:lipoprotein-releasing system ATP-binding protein
MREVLVEARSVGREYGKGDAAVTAVANASCTISLGDRIALVGPSGSGKSTLLYLLAGLEPPSSGNIVWPSVGNGDRLMPAFAGFVFQVPNLLPPLTAVENVAVPLLIAGVPARRAREAALSILKRFDLSDVADRSAEDLSGGQAERVGLARALVSEPSLVLADEPTGQLDGTTAALVIDRLLEAADHSGAAVIVATHDERIASRMPTRWTMNHGVLDTSP